LEKRIVKVDRVIHARSRMETKNRESYSLFTVFFFNYLPGVYFTPQHYISNFIILFNNLQLQKNKS